MKFRPVRGGLKESMAEVVEVKDHHALCEHLRQTIGEFLPPFWDRAVRVENMHCFDDRIGWDTYMVTLNGNAMGYTNGPLAGDSHAN